MSLSRKENAIREQRTNLAITKNLMGPTGKLGVIAQGLGDPIIRSVGGMYDVRFLDDPYEDFSEFDFETTLSGQNGPLAFQDKIEQGQEDDQVELDGYVFDGLSRGLHLEIQYLHDSNKLTVYYRGYKVYQEIGGELAAFAPFPEWEEKVDSLFPKAKANWELRRGQETEKLAEMIDRKKVSFWEKLRMRWGL
jgi:hypothetical protein